MTKTKAGHQQAAEVSKVPFENDLKKSLLNGAVWGLLAALVLWGGTFLGTTAITVVNAVTLSLFYLAPLPLLYVGFRIGLDAALVCVIVALGCLFALTDPETTLLIIMGLYIPLLIILALHDTRFWKTSSALPSNSGQQDGGWLQKSAWAYRPEVEGIRFRMGITLTTLALYFAAALALTETLLGGLGLETLHQSLFASFNIQAMSAAEIQAAQMAFPMMELLPSGIVIFLIAWILTAAKISLFLVRWRRDDDEPRLHFTRGAIPLWYVVIIGLLGVAASQVDGQLRFIFGNMVLILAMPGLFVGFGLMHHVASFFRFPWIVVLLLYCVTALTVQFWSLTVVTVMGLLDASLQIREWLTAKLGRKMEKKYA